VELQEDVLDCVQHESNLLCISCACIMGINLLGRRALVERDEAVQQIVAGQVVVVAVLVVGEVIAQRGARELLSEEIDFV
jgi:hypothetical protein